MSSDIQPKPSVLVEFGIGKKDPAAFFRTNPIWVPETALDE
jgi:hypothetical protein